MKFVPSLICTVSLFASLLHFAGNSEALPCSDLANAAPTSTKIAAIPLDSPAGQAALTQAQQLNHANQLSPILKNFRAQVTPNLCSVATGTIAIRSLRPSQDFQQGDFLNESTDRIRSSQIIRQGEAVVRDLPDGQTLGQLEQMLSQAHGLEVAIVHAAASGNTAESFRRHVRDVVASKHQFMIVNYEESQVFAIHHKGGHFSPVAAYNPEQDLVLIADVYQPGPPRIESTASWFWVKLPTLFSAMLKPDNDSGLSRGYLIIQ